MSFRNEIAAAVSVATLLTISIIVELGAVLWICIALEIQPAWHPYVGVLIVEFLFTALVTVLSEHASGDRSSGSTDQALAAFVLASGSLIPLGVQLVLVFGSGAVPTPSELVYVVRSFDPENWFRTYQVAIVLITIAGFLISVLCASLSRRRKPTGRFLDRTVWIGSVAILTLAGMTLRPWTETTQQSYTGPSFTLPLMFLLIAWVLGVFLIAWAARIVSQIVGLILSYRTATPVLMLWARRALALSVGVLFAGGLFWIFVPIATSVVSGWHSVDARPTISSLQLANGVPDVVALQALRLALLGVAFAAVLFIAYKALPLVIAAAAKIRMYGAILLVWIERLLSRIGLTRVWSSAINVLIAVLGIIIASATLLLVGSAAIHVAVNAFKSIEFPNFLAGESPKHESATVSVEPAQLSCTLEKLASATEGPNWTYSRDDSIDLPIKDCSLTYAGKLSAAFVIGVASPQGDKQSQSVLSLRRGRSLLNILMASAGPKDFVPSAIVVLGRQTSSSANPSTVKEDLSSTRPVIGYVQLAEGDNYLFDPAEFLKNIRAQIETDRLTRDYEHCQIVLIQQSSMRNQNSRIVSCD